MVAQNDAALTVFIDAKDHRTGKTAKYFSAHFLRFRGSKIVEFCSISDSLDAVRQLDGLTVQSTG